MKQFLLKFRNVVALILAFGVLAIAFLSFGRLLVGLNHGFASGEFFDVAKNCFLLNCVALAAAILGNFLYCATVRDKVDMLVLSGIGAVISFLIFGGVFVLSGLLSGAYFVSAGIFFLTVYGCFAIFLTTSYFTHRLRWHNSSVDRYLSEETISV